MDFLKELEFKNGEAVKFLKERFSGIRGGRPTAKLVEDVGVEYLGQKMSVKQLGNASVVPPREIQISLWDRQSAPAVAKSIESFLSVGVNVDGGLIRVFLPPLSEERRAELIKLVKREIEEAKIKIRAIRDETMKKIKTQSEEGKISEDEKFKLKDGVQKITDKANEEIDEILKNKIKEIEE